jgi:hypothetical protein
VAPDISTRLHGIEVDGTSTAAAIAAGKTGEVAFASRSMSRAMK